MKFLILVTFLLCAKRYYAQQCNAAGNLFIFSNYDGSRATAAARLNINVDVNIPNIRIGICSYERVTVNITGTYAANVIAVRYAGYNAMGNCNCGASAGCANTSVITGVPTGIVSYSIIPPVTLADANGYSSLICAYQCVNGNQGGCNTAQQVVHYFGNTLGGTFRSHTVQYGCWNGSTQNLSTTGNCCLVNPLSASLTKFDVLEENDRAKIEWQTVSETNNDFFVIERSHDAESWEETERIDAAGNSNELLTYVSYDKLSMNANTYYRLKQVDFDGEFEYSEIRSIARLAENSTILFYPNPSDGKVFFIQNEQSSKIKVSIFDCVGKLVLTECLESKIDLNYIDLSGLSNGVFTIQIQNLNSLEIKSEKIIFTK